jgi:hypothetical protein
MARSRPAIANSADTRLSEAARRVIFCGGVRPPVMCAREIAGHESLRRIYLTSSEASDQSSRLNYAFLCVRQAEQTNVEGMRQRNRVSSKGRWHDVGRATVDNVDKCDMRVPNFDCDAHSFFGPRRVHRLCIDLPNESRLPLGYRPQTVLISVSCVQQIGQKWVLFSKLFKLPVPSVAFPARRSFKSVKDALEMHEERGPLSLDLSEMAGSAQIDQTLMAHFNLGLSTR